MKKISLIIAAALVLASCTDKELTAIDERLSSSEEALGLLGERITTLAQTVLQINKDTQSLLVLRGGVTINTIEGSDDAGWTLTTGSGQTITVPPQGKKGNAPVISLDEDGFWMVDYGEGATYILDQDGNKVSQKGKGSAGKDADSSPILGVSEDGFWKISYDNGTSWDFLLDQEGNKVPTAVEIGETLFKSVTIEGNNVTIVVKNGETFVVPLVKNFLCAIQGSEAVELFAAAQTKSYTVQLEGVLELFVTCPSGWSTSLSEGSLSVTAPAATKVYFDTEEYVAIYAVSTDGHSAVASMKVAISE